MNIAISNIKKLEYFKTSLEGDFEDSDEEYTGEERKQTSSKFGQSLTTLVMTCKCPVEEFFINKENKWFKCISPFALGHANEPFTQLLSYWGLSMTIQLTGIKDLSFYIDKEFKRLKDAELIHSVRKIKDLKDFQEHYLDKQAIDKV